MIGQDPDGEFGQMVSDVIDGLLDDHVSVGQLPDRPAIESLLAAAAFLPLTIVVDSLVGATCTRVRDLLCEDVARAVTARCARVDALAGRVAAGNCGGE